MTQEQTYLEGIVKNLYFQEYYILEGNVGGVSDTDTVRVRKLAEMAVDVVNARFQEPVRGELVSQRETAIDGVAAAMTRKTPPEQRS